MVGCFTIRYKMVWQRGFQSSEWAMSSLGALMQGGVNACHYTKRESTPAEALSYIIVDKLRPAANETVV